jgi:desulfoferrodoxin (superoxide reductase-like protein)
MKKFIVLIALVVFPLSILFAHPASEVNVNYTAKTKVLMVDVVHMVSTSKVTDTKKHYIKEIIVTLNGKKVKTKKFRDQTGDSVKAEFKVKAKSGDKINVTATCSLAGSKSTEIIVE